ncbi:hypothetical protein MYXO_00050 [Myxococcaceae bacterium]|jgi:hypothetical protein|nr:hypothetical protein MYXO_00050 [Myxococcaceae bacterium]
MRFSRRRLRAASAAFALALLLFGNASVSRALVLAGWLGAAHEATLRFDVDHADLWLAHASSAEATRGAPSGTPGLPEAVSSGCASGMGSAGHLLHGCVRSDDSGAPDPRPSWDPTPAARAGFGLPVGPVVSFERHDAGSARRMLPPSQRTPILRA